jgi:DNA-binding HxlR family transcriptional regulator
LPAEQSIRRRPTADQRTVPSSREDYVSAPLLQRSQRRCSVARTLEVMGDPWGFLIICALFFGVRRFADIQKHGGVPKKMLAARLGSLVKSGVLRRRRYQARPIRYEYLLTEKGHELYPPAIALLQWGDRWMAGGEEIPVRLTHKNCGKTFRAVVACSECREALRINDVQYADGPGAGHQPQAGLRRHRRAPAPEIYQRSRPCSLARVLTLVADRWLFLLLREACFGVRRFDDFVQTTGIARNIIAERLGYLVEHGMLEKKKYQDRPERFEYRLMEKGREVYEPILGLMQWGDRWESGKAGPPLVLMHKKCGKRFDPLVICSRCSGRIASREVSYRETFACS